jgi:short subunit dehydrogenase-like uncharacterized protein
MTVLIYGATGYTGRLITRMAAGYGVHPVLAGRSAGAVAALAAEHGLEHRCFSLDRPDELRRGLAGAGVVLHCAGPFANTFRTMSDACLDLGVHYLDITGEVDVFEALAARDAEARAAGVMLLPGVGYDVVPSDCLAAHLAGRLPGARRLLLAISSSGPLSHGTATTTMQNQHRGGVIRRDGAVVRVPVASRSRQIDFGDGRPRHTVTIAWGDVVTAYHTTGIPDIEVYAAVPRRLAPLLRATRHLGWLLRARPVQALQRRLIDRWAPGPDEQELHHGTSRVWGRVEADDGRSATAALRGPNAYLLTAHTALLAVQRVLEGGASPGFQTPSMAFGADIIRAVPGVELFDIDTQGG